LYNSLLRMLGSADDAADIVQDTFVQAYTKLSSFRGGSQFYTWLYRIAFNLAMSHLRRSHKKASLDEMKTLVGAEPTDGQPPAATRLIEQERAELVHASLAELTTEHRQILVLREIDGCSYEE